MLSRLKMKANKNEGRKTRRHCPPFGGYLIMNKKELPRTSPESVGISSRRIRKLIEDLEQVTEMHGLMIARGGKVISENWWAPYTEDLPHILHSLGKSYVSTGIGLAVTEGLIDPEERIVDLFAEDLKELGITPSEFQQKLTVRHLLTMSNGMARQPKLNEHIIENYLREEVVYEPGTRFMYNTAGTSLLCEILRRKVGQQIYPYMTEKLFRSIGIETDKLLWMKYKNGLDASPGLASTVENNLRLGLLYLQDGVWEGKRYLSHDWVQKATTNQMDNAGTSPDKEACAGYGYQIWMCSLPGAFRFDGGHGQYVIGASEQNIVVSLTQSAGSFGAAAKVLELVLNFIAEQESAAALPEDSAALAALKAFLASRALASGTVTKLPENIHNLDGVYHTTRGELNIYPETRVDNKENWDAVFYDIDDADIREVSVAAKEEGFAEITFNRYTTLKVRLDGVNEIVESKGAMPSYHKTCSTGYFDGPDTLVVHTRWIQTCPTMTMTFRRYAGKLIINAVLNTLHDFCPETVYHLELEPVK